MENKIREAIHLLQSALKQTTISAGTKSPVSGAGSPDDIPQLQNIITQSGKMAQTLQPQIQQLNRVMQCCLNLMSRIINYSTFCKKFSQTSEGQLKKMFMEFSKQTEKVQKNQNFIPHAKAIRELLSGTFWVFTNSPQFIIKGAIQAADFNALKFKTKKVIPHNQWYNKISESMKVIQKFSKINYPSGLTFTPHGEDRWNEILSGSSSSHPPQASSQPSQQTKKEIPKSQTKKAPKKQMVGLNWMISNFEQQEMTLTSSQVQMKNGIFIQNCHNCLFKIDQKCKSIMVNKCENVAVILKGCVSGVQLMNSNNLTCKILANSPSVSVDKSVKVKIILNSNHLNCDIVSSKASQLNISYEKEEGIESKQYMVSQQLITKWNQNTQKFQTGIYDKFL